MTGQVIVSGDGWVLDKHGKILADAFGFDLRTEPEPMPQDGITYLMNYAQGRKLTFFDCYGKVVSMLTHREPSDSPLYSLWLDAASHSDALVPMSEQSALYLSGVEMQKATIIPLPVPDYITKRRPRIGIAGIRNAANEHRKGWDLVDRLRNDHPEWDIVTTGGALSEPEMLAWYRSLDLYLCPSRYEGGPMGVIEAAEFGLWIVVPMDVGWCDGYGHTLYEAGNYDMMVQAVEETLDDAQLGRDMKRKATTVSDYIEAHRRLFASLL